MKGKIIVDGRRLLDPNALSSGFTYVGVGLSVSSVEVIVVDDDARALALDRK